MKSQRFIPHTFVPVDETHRVVVATNMNDAKWRSVFFPQYRKGNTWVYYTRKGILVASNSERGARLYIAAKTGKER